MVYETRKVVEDYVLYKIKEHLLSASNNNDSDLPNGNSHGMRLINRSIFPQPQDPPNEINNAVRLVAFEFEELYRNKYPDLLEKIRDLHIATWNIDKVFRRITQDVFRITYDTPSESSSGATNSRGGRKSRGSSPAFQDSDRIDQTYTVDDSNVKWGHVIALLVFSGVLAVRSVEIDKNEQVDEIVNWVSRFLDAKLGPWLHRHGSWEGFATWHEQTKGTTIDKWFDAQYVGYGLRAALRVSGAVAVVALGALVLSRK